MELEAVDPRHLGVVKEAQRVLPVRQATGTDDPGVTWHRLMVKMIITLTFDAHLAISPIYGSFTMFFRQNTVSFHWFSMFSIDFPWFLWFSIGFPLVLELVFQPNLVPSWIPTCPHLTLRALPALRRFVPPVDGSGRVKQGQRLEGPW